MSLSSSTSSGCLPCVEKTGWALLLACQGYHLASAFNLVGMRVDDNLALLASQYAILGWAWGAISREKPGLHW